MERGSLAKEASKPSRATDLSLVVSGLLSPSPHSRRPSDEPRGGGQEARSRPARDSVPRARDSRGRGLHPVVHQRLPRGQHRGRHAYLMLVTPIVVVTVGHAVCVLCLFIYFSARKVITPRRCRTFYCFVMARALTERSLRAHCGE